MSLLALSALFEYLCYTWVYGNYNCFNCYSAGTDFSRQHLTSTDARFWHLKTIHAMKGLIKTCRAIVLFIGDLSS